MSNDSWQTPDEVFKPLNEKFKFQFDLCANNLNKKCNKYTENIEFSLARGDLDDYHRFWMNPPYSRGHIDKCMRIASFLGAQGKTVVCLVRDDPTTKWYKDFVSNEDAECQIWRLNHRVKFMGASSCYNFPICLIIYSKQRDLLISGKHFYWDYKKNRSLL